MIKLNDEWAIVHCPNFKIALYCLTHDNNVNECITRHPSTLSTDEIREGRNGLLSTYDVLTKEERAKYQFILNSL